MSRFLLILLLFCFSIYESPKNDSIHIISWNIQHFGKTKKSAELEKIANIVKDVDIIAIQEVVAGYGGAQAVAKLSDILNRKGEKWDYIVSNPTKSSKYMKERYAFIWKTKDIKIKNRGRLVTELHDTIEREPHMVEFYTKGKRFTVVNFHSISYSKNPRSEIAALTDFIIDNLETPLLLAGDFNLDGEDPVFKNFLNMGYKASVYSEKTTLKQKCYNGLYLNYSIDNIYYSNGLSKVNSGVVDFVLVCDELKNARQLSDHLPVYLEFRIN